MLKSKKNLILGVALIFLEIQNFLSKFEKTQEYNNF